MFGNVASIALAATISALGYTCAFAEDVGREIVLETGRTAMAFARDGEGVWRLLSYSEKPVSSADAAKLAWDPFVGRHDLGYRVPATYVTYGQKMLHDDVNKIGGLTVTHADGVVSTDLVHEKAEFVKDADGVRHLVLTLVDKAYPFRVIQHFRAIADCDVVETWVEIANGEPGPVKLVTMDTLSLVLPNVAERYHLVSLTGAHYNEGRLVESEIPCGRTETLSAHAGIWSSWGAAPEFMLGLGGKPTETDGRVIGGALCWSGTWRIEFAHDHVHHLAVRGGPDTSAGAYVLESGRTLTLPTFALTYSAHGKGEVSRNLHRWARNWRFPDGRKLRPIPMCSWAVGYSISGGKLVEMMEGTKNLGAELFVLDDGWFGRGKYARDPKHGDRVGLGDWFVNRELIPQGLDGLANEAKKRGIGFGIWVEPEMVNTNSWLYEAHPGWVLREPTRPTYARRGKSQLVLDLTRKDVRDNLFGQLDTLYSGIPDLAYVKWDANAAISCLGTGALPADRQPNLWFDYVRGLEDLLCRLRTKYPKLDLQCCASGGGRMDYGFMKYADEFWASDDVDPRERVFIQWGASYFFPASAIASHIAPCPNWHLGRVTPIKYRCDVAMSARFGFEFDPKAMSKEEFETSRRATETYKSIRPVVQQGDLHRLVSPFENDYASLMYVSEDRARAVVFLYGLSRSGYRDGFPAPLRLRGLDPAANYRIREIDPGRNPHIRIGGDTVSGAALMELGLPVRLNPGDWDSAIFELELERRGQQITLGVNEYDFFVYRPKQEFDSRQFGDVCRRGDAYNDHFQVIWDETRRLLYAFWTQASWEGAPDSHICFAKSADKGRTWTEPVLLAGSETRQHPRPEAYYQQPMLAKSGRLYCLWTERHVPQGMVGTYSDDAGETWAATKVMGVRRSDQDPADPRVCPNYINWQRPLRLGKDGRFFVASSHHGKSPYDEKEGCKINFWEFLNIDENPEVNAIRLDYFAWDRQALDVGKLPQGGGYFVPKFYPARNPPVPEGPAVEEAAIVKLPDGRLFALMRSSVGSPVWSQSRDGGRTWSGLKALVDANGKPFLHPRSPCPIYDRGGDEAASGEYFAFIHNTFDFKSQTACQPRPQLYLIAGKFDPTGDQPIRFSAPKLFCKRTFGNSLYSSYTVADGEGVLWFPDVKYYLLGRKIGNEWFK